MYAGLALTVAAAVVAIVEHATGALSRHLHDVYSGTPPCHPDLRFWPTCSYSARSAPLGGCGLCGPSGGGSVGLPPVSTVLFVLATGLAVANLTIREYGQTILPTNLGLVGLLPCLTGLVAVTLLWRARDGSHRPLTTEPAT